VRLRNEEKTMMTTQPEKTCYRRLLTIITSLLVIFIFQVAANAVVPENVGAVADMNEEWGIEITSVRMAADGHMVDFRYRVLDAKKAETLFVRKNKPYLVDQTSKKVLAVPSMGKIGPLRTANKPQAGRIYWMFFGNNQGLIKPGSKVTVIIGDFRAENITVQ
jgi:hypothetical protein